MRDLIFLLATLVSLSSATPPPPQLFAYYNWYYNQTCENALIAGGGNKIIEQCDEYNDGAFLDRCADPQPSAIAMPPGRNCESPPSTSCFDTGNGYVVVACCTTEVIDEGSTCRRQSPVDETCSPQPKITKKQCQQLRETCAKKEKSIRMKWTGLGCENANNQRMNDAGCQCAGYCGYQCKSACNRDSECRWDKEAKLCRVSATGEVGVKISPCLPVEV